MNGGNTSITMRDSTTFAVRETFPTVRKYLERARSEGSALAVFAVGDKNRVAINPSEVASIYEIARGGQRAK